jgi:hypothetical protein
VLDVEHVPHTERGYAVLDQALGRLGKRLLNLAGADNSDAWFLQAAQHQHGGGMPALA